MLGLSKFCFKIKLISTNTCRTIQTKAINSLLDLDLDKTNDADALNKQIRVIGWVKSYRDQKEIKFLHLNDGTDTRNLQLVLLKENFVHKDDFDTLSDAQTNMLHFNTSIEAVGRLVKSSHKKQNLEMQVTDLKIIGKCDPQEYPFQVKKVFTFEQMRKHINLRSNLSTFSSILKYRSELTMSLHEFFYTNSFTQVHTPIMTSNNCEGGCETFQVTSNDKDKELLKCKVK